MDTLTPWQLGCVNTTPQKALRLPQPLERRMHKPLKMAEILRNTIRNCALKIAPHMFIWVKLRRITWEPKCLKARMFVNKVFNQLTPMRHSGIPEQQDRPAEMFEKMPEKLDDLRRLDVFASIKSRVEGQPPALWSNTDGGDGRNLSPTAGTSQLRRLPFGRPSADQVRNQKEAAFVKKHQMGAKSFGFFYMWPLIAFPFGYGLFIPLPCTLHRLLATPPQHGQNFPDIGQGIPHPEFGLDYLTDAAQRPDVCAIPRL